MVRKVVLSFLERKILAASLDRTGRGNIRGVPQIPQCVLGIFGRCHRASPVRLRCKCRRDCLHLRKHSACHTGGRIFPPSRCRCGDGCGKALEAAVFPEAFVVYHDLPSCTAGIRTGICNAGEFFIKSRESDLHGFPPCR